MSTKMPPRRGTSKKKTARRLSPAEWIEAEELYRNGWTQAQIADKYGIRVETVSRHMTKRSVKGGERAEAVREELAAALLKKQRDWAEAKAARQVDAKSMLFKMNNALLSTYAREFKMALDSGGGLAAMQGIAKALKDSVQALKVSREEVYVLLEISENGGGEELPELMVSAMTLEEEADLRQRVAPDDDDTIDPAEEMAAAVDQLDKAVENGSA